MSGDDSRDDVNARGTTIEVDGQQWCVVAVVDGRRRVISRHRSRDAAEAASRSVNASANYHDFQP